LIQIDGNFGTRSVQSEVAHEMIFPASSQNTALQLNMGEGKSSVIVPIVAASLADKSRLVRVVVLKPLWRQMFHTLVERLAGLANRRIYYLPFGRHINVGVEEIQTIRDIFTECMQEGGVLLVQPEHILSFKLMGISQLTSLETPLETDVEHSLRDTQDWLSKNTRDILDESDEILHVRYQLVYTVGNQNPLQDHPDRWTTTQQIFPLIAKHIDRLKQAYPDKLKYAARSGGQFPSIRIMPEADEVAARLIESVAKDALDGRIPNLNLNILAPSTREVALRFLTEKYPQVDCKSLRVLDQSVQNGLLLLRGLLTCGILVFALKDKHYRVNYGLCLSRSLMAVPYHAKVCALSFFTSWMRSEYENRISQAQGLSLGIPMSQLYSHVSATTTKALRTLS
jgi:hypothetical protein